jgi:hypothetical protein
MGDLGVFLAGSFGFMVLCGLAAGLFRFIFR